MLTSWTHLTMCLTVTVRCTTTFKAPSLHYSLKTFTDAIKTNDLMSDQKFATEVKSTCLTPVRSRYCPGTKCSALSSVPKKQKQSVRQWYCYEGRSVPGRSCALSLILNSINTLLGGTPCLRKWPLRGLVTRQSFALSAPTWIETSPSFCFWVFTCTTWQSRIWEHRWNNSH
jgi:hypothetical protein